jgi:hypothetical protein
LVNVTIANFYAPNNYPADFIVDSTNPSRNNTLVIALPQPTHALALDYGGLGFTGVGTATITLSNGHVFTQARLPTVGNTTFVGFVSSDPITTLTLVTTNDSWVVLDVILGHFAGIPVQTNCQGQSVSVLAQQHGDLATAAAALEFPSVQALQDAIREFCEE